VAWLQLAEVDQYLVEAVQTEKKIIKTLKNY
jgi:hypothetical protein